VFWDLSPRELAREFKAADAQRQDAYDRDVMLAWNVVRIYAMAMEKKRLPDVKALFADRGESRAQTRAEMAAAMATLSQQYGLTLRVKES
jgi:hypothetical protein